MKEGCWNFISALLPNFRELILCLLAMNSWKIGLVAGCLAPLAFLIVDRTDRDVKAVTAVTADLPAVAVVSDSLEEAEPEVEVVPTNVADLPDSIIAEYAQRNSCYLPLLEDRSYFHPKQDWTYVWDDLLNASLGPEHPYAHRYLVGDFSSLDENGEGRGIDEKHPDPRLLEEFKGMDEGVWSLMDSAYRDTAAIGQLLSLMTQHLDGEDLELAQNFMRQVWKYQTPPLKRRIAKNRSTYYEVGQTMNACLAFPDTLVCVAKFATSSKRMDIRMVTNEEGEEEKEHFQYLPIGRKRKYYASCYTISSKNWESQRKYGVLDAKHDERVGGGHERVTWYQGKSELPNFLTMKPAPAFRGCLPNNGIHEVSLSALSRGMLGCANSLGCIRVSDFASKFLRWWTPQDANFFVAYQDDRYLKEIDFDEEMEFMPFANEKEGNAFRKWMHQRYPVVAAQIKLDSVGKHDNGYILDAFHLCGEDYKAHLKSLETEVHE